MIKIILTKSCWDEQKNLLNYDKDIVWINSEILEETEIKKLRSQGLNLTNWNHHIGSAESIESALKTVKEHHPSEKIWCEKL
jgi:hypothetical protein